MSHPYADLPERALWRRAVADRAPLEMQGLYQPRFEITKETAIATAGSCFAQHIAAQFKTRGYRFLDLEPAPEAFLSQAQKHAFGYDLYSARYGNIYFARQLTELFQRAAGSLTPSETEWETDGRFYDPFRPAIEPGGYASAAELAHDRAFHLSQVADMLRQTDVFCFTFGQTEAWQISACGTTLPTCPGTVAGQFDPGRYHFHNFGFDEVLRDFETFMDIARAANPEIRFLVTVSPVPLTATASADHVLVAAQRSKAILRAVCAMLYERHDRLDYFPSYELIATHPARAVHYNANLRTVTKSGVTQAMHTFFDAHSARPLARSSGPLAAASGALSASEEDMRLVCEEDILETFGP